jgi:hypothetical protein
MKLESITFILENCDSITIDGRYIDSFHIEDARTSIFGFNGNNVRETETIHHFAVNICAGANVERYAFGLQRPEMGDERVFNRLLEYDDITQVELNLVSNSKCDNRKSEGVHYHYDLHWVGDDENNNAAQKSYLSKTGNLYILVDENRNIRDYFPISDIEDGCVLDCASL